MRKANTLPIAVMAFAVVAFLVMVSYAITPHQKWPWSTNVAVSNTSTTTVVQNSNTTLNANTVVNKNTASNTNSATDATKDWKTYTNTELGFRFSYPPNSTAGVVPNEKLANTDIQTYIGVTFLPLPKENPEPNWGVFVYDAQKKTSEQVIAEIGKQFSDRQETRSTVTFNGITATKILVTTKQFPNWDSVTIVFINNGKVYSITNGAVADSRFETFYESFAFTSPTADWKTYTDTEHGFSVKYPKLWEQSGKCAEGVCVGTRFSASDNQNEFIEVDYPTTENALSYRNRDWSIDELKRYGDTLVDTIEFKVGTQKVYEKTIRYNNIPRTDVMSWFYHNTNIFWMYFGNGERSVRISGADESLMKSMISTFTFTK